MDHVGPHPENDDPPGFVRAPPWMGLTLGIAIAAAVYGGLWKAFRAVVD